MTDQHIAHPERLSASQAADAIAEGRLTVEELARALLGRIAERAEVHAWAHVDADLVIREAQRLDAVPMHKRKSPLFGVPVGVEDIFYTKGETRLTMLSLLDNVSQCLSLLSGL